MTAWTEASSSVIHVAEDVIRQYHPKLSELRIGFLFRDQPAASKGKTVLAQIQAVPDRLKPLLDYDLILWVSEKDWELLPDARRKALIDHEFCHVQVDVDVRLVGHDVEEFYAVIERHGLWRPELLRVADALKQAAQLPLPGVLPAAPPRQGSLEALDPETARKAVAALEMN